MSSRGHWNTTRNKLENCCCFDNNSLRVHKSLWTFTVMLELYAWQHRSNGIQHSPGLFFSSTAVSKQYLCTCPLIYSTALISQWFSNTALSFPTSHTSERCKNRSVWWSRRPFCSHGLYNCGFGFNKTSYRSSYIINWLHIHENSHYLSS